MTVPTPVVTALVASPPEAYDSPRQVWCCSASPERVLLSAVDLTGDWTTWRATQPAEVLQPQAPYECSDLPNVPSAAGDIDVPARQIRDPFVFEEGGRAFLFYSTCGEQGIAGATIEIGDQ